MWSRLPSIKTRDGVSNKYQGVHVKGRDWNKIRKCTPTFKKAPTGLNLGWRCMSSSFYRTGFICLGFSGYCRTKRPLVSKRLRFGIFLTPTHPYWFVLFTTKRSWTCWFVMLMDFPFLRERPQPPSIKSLVECRCTHRLRSWIIWETSDPWQRNDWISQFTAHPLPVRLYFFAWRASDVDGHFFHEKATKHLPVLWINLSSAGIHLHLE